MIQIHVIYVWAISRCFVTFVQSLTADDKREKNALDDILGALQYVKDSAAVAEPSRKKARLSADPEHGSATLKATAFCVSIFLQFTFEGEVSVSGKLVKSYSSLRPELQQIMLSAQETFACETSEGKEVDAMEFAALLTEQYADRPVLSIVGDDEEESCAKRVVAAMNITSQRTATVDPLREFVAKKLHLPLMLHPVPQQTLLELATLTSSADSTMKSLMDLVAFIQSKLEEMFPFSWATFASDIAETLVCKGHFIESSGEARYQQSTTCWFHGTILYLCF